MNLAQREVLLWTICFGLMLSAGVAEDVLDEPSSTSPGLVDRSVEVNYNDTSTSTFPTTTTTVASTSTATETTEPLSTMQPVVAPRANASPPTSVSIKSTSAAMTAGTTSKPSSKRQISLSEFQQLVAKVNDEIGMLRNQSANLSQTYDELARRYNERTSQIPIVLYDVTDCTNGTKAAVGAAALDDAVSGVGNVTTEVVVEGALANGTGLGAPKGDSPNTVISTTTLEPDNFTSTETVSSSEGTPALVKEPEVAPVLDTAPQNPANAQTQIYGNKYYNYVHYFMYPPSEEQLKQVLTPGNEHTMRKDGHFSQKVAAVRDRQKEHGLGQAAHEPLEVEMPPFGQAPLNNRWGLPGNHAGYQSELRGPPSLGGNENLWRGPVGNKAYAQRPLAPNPYESPFRRRNDPRPVVPLQESAVRQLTEERTPQRNPYRDDFRLEGIPRPNPAERVAPSGPTKQTMSPDPILDKVASPLDKFQRKISPPTRVKQPETPWRSLSKRTTTPPSLDSVLSAGLKSVSFSIPTTIKPVPGVARNGWDGYDFTFVRKAMEIKKQSQSELRSARGFKRDL